MSESTAALEGNVSPPTVTNNSDVGNKNNKNPANQITTETTMTINDPPVIETSQRMPPLVVKQFGLLKPGVPPTAGSVSFDYTGPPVKVTNGTVLDLVNQFGIQNAWLAVLKLRGYSVSKEEGETLLPIKRFRERVRKLKSTAETLKSRSDDSTTFLSKEFASTATMGPNGAPATKNGPKGYSTTDAVIESILRQAVNETDGAGPSGPSTAAASNETTKPKRGRKKGKTEAPATASNANPTNPHRASSATIDDVVSSIVNKIRNNEPFDTDLNIDLPTSPPIQQPQQPQVVYAPHIPGQTYVMLQDDQMIPIMPQQIQQSAPVPPPKTTRSRRRGKTAQQQVPTQIVQYSNFVPQPQTAGQVRTTTSTSNMAPHVTVVTVPRGQQTTTNYVVPSGYANNNQAVIYSNINDYMRNPTIQNSAGQITKVVTYQPGVQYAQPFVANPSPQGMSPNGVYQPGPAHPQGQYMVHPVPTAAPPPQQVVQSKPTPPVPQNEVNDDRKKTTRRKIKPNKNDMFMENFNESDFEEFATPKRKESIKKTIKKKEAKSADDKKAAKAAAIAEKPEKAPKKTVKEKETEKPKKKLTRKRKHSVEPESESEEAIESDAPSPVILKGKQTGEVAQLKRQLQAERSRHYTQKRRATKLDDDYKRVLDRLQQTELNLALQMSECERLQGEMKKMRTENEELTARLNGQDLPKPNLPVVKAGRRSAVAKKPVIKRKVESPSPAPIPTPPSKRSSAATNKGITPKAPVNNKKRGRHTGPSPDVDEPSPPTSADGNKPAFTPDDFVPRRAAAAKRIRYF
uniref:Uncharacterized protein n=1 Tax=Panagrolaimus sp. JU765 TaxID=591449 RepID=A0AC34PWJ5_9BILA